MKEQKTGGIGLLIGGGLLLAGGILVPSAALAAAGMSALIVGYTSVALAGTRSSLSPVSADDRAGSGANASDAAQDAERAHRRLILRLGLAYVGIDAILALASQPDISVYFIANAIIFLIVAISQSGLTHHAKRALGTTASLLFVGFLAALAFKLASA